MPPQEEPGWLPRWISATPFRHPIFLVALAIPPLAYALHALLSITLEPFHGDFDIFLHLVKEWSLLISPLFVWCGWRKLLFVLNRRPSRSAKASLVLTWLLLPYLALQLWWFQVGESSIQPHRFSPTFPAFLAGPLIGFAMGFLHVRQARQPSLLGFLAITISLAWALLPFSLEVDAWTSGGWDSGNNWFNVVPLLGSAATGLVAGLSMSKMMITGFFSSAYFYLPLLLGCAFLEIRLKRLPVRSSLITLAGILTFLPFFHEWENYWWD